MLCKLHILIVGGHDEVTQLIHDQLMGTFGAFLHLECASALPTACESLTDTDFDAIFFDLSLAKQNRDFALTALRSLAPNTPLFLLLDKDLPLHEIGSAEIGSGGCLLKEHLQQGAWLDPLSTAMANRRAFGRIEEMKRYCASTNKP
jgi:DNA-binding NarL/FixJ family response regulator